MILQSFPDDMADRTAHNVPRPDEWNLIPEQEYEQVAWRIIDTFEESEMNFHGTPPYYLTVAFMLRDDVGTEHTLRRARAEVDQLAKETDHLLTQEVRREIMRGHVPGTPIPDEIERHRSFLYRSQLRLGILACFGFKEDLDRIRRFIDLESESLQIDAEWYLEILDARLEGREPPVQPGLVEREDGTDDER